MNLIRNLAIIKANLNDYPIVQNMTQLYIYDSSRECGFALSELGLYPHKGYKEYFEEADQEAYLVRVKDELAGFVLLNKACTTPDGEWNVGQFFILAKFQGQGIGREVATRIWGKHSGRWEASVLPQNKRALHFWRSVISVYTNGRYKENLKIIYFDQKPYERVIFSFDSTKTA